MSTKDIPLVRKDYKSRIKALTKDWGITERRLTELIESDPFSGCVPKRKYQRNHNGRLFDVYVWGDK